MRLSEIFDHLSYGELSQMHIGEGDGEGITPENRHRIITHVMLGLTDLHRRFQLREAEAVVDLSPGLTLYTLEEPDLLKIEGVHTPDKTLTLDDGSDPDVVYRRSRNVLRVPEGVLKRLLEDGVKQLRVTYRADHLSIGKREASEEPEKVEVDLPPSHLKALLLFVASRVMNPIGSAGGATDFHEGNNYAQKYERACRELEAGGYQLSFHEEEGKFRQRGFV